MASRHRVSLVVAIAAAAAAAIAVVRAQTEASRPQFRVAVDYVEVDARVVDATGSPIRGLAQGDFTVFEDGVPQKIADFSAIDLPVPSATARVNPSSGLRSDVASNVITSARGRTYLIVADTNFIGQTRTLLTRKFLRDFIERSVGPDDLVGFTTTGRDNAYENFTNDKARLLAAADRVVGQYESPTVQTLTDISTRSAFVGGPGAPNVKNAPVASGGMDAPLRSLRQLTRLTQEMSAAEGGSKAIILVTESMPFQMNATQWDTQALFGDIGRLSNAARRGNVPIYPVDPRGLSVGQEDAIVVGTVDAIGTTGTSLHPDVSVKDEVRRAQERMRAIADDSGGVPIFGNDIASGLDRIVNLSSRYYMLGYYSTNARPDGKYHRIEVRVNRADARVLARRGYTAVGGEVLKPEKLDGPAGSTIELRQTLNAVLPVADLPLLATAGAFRHGKDRASVALVLEGAGADLAWSKDSLSLSEPLELTAVALDGRGAIREGEVHRLQLSGASERVDRVRQFGFRWLGRLSDLKSGHYQIRFVASNGRGRQGSVFYDLDIPDFSKNVLTMSDVLLASAVATQRPTLKPDPELATALPAPPTTLRKFLSADTLAVYAEVYDNLAAASEIETGVTIIDEHAQQQAHVVERRQTNGGGMLPIKARFPLAQLAPGAYTLAIEARQTANRSVSTGRAVPFRIVSR